MTGQHPPRLPVPPAHPPQAWRRHHSSCAVPHGSSMSRSARRNRTRGVLQARVDRARMRSAATSGSTCSQTVITRHPLRRSAAAFRRSLALLRAIFSRHHLLLCLGSVWCHGQPCQKQPWTNTAVLRFGSTMSGRPGRSGAWVSTRNPRRLRASTSNTSGLVPEVRCWRIRDATPSSLGTGCRAVTPSFSPTRNRSREATNFAP